MQGASLLITAIETVTNVEPLLEEYYRTLSGSFSGFESSNTHHGASVSPVLDKLAALKEAMQKDLCELRVRRLSAYLNLCERGSDGMVGDENLNLNDDGMVGDENIDLNDSHRSVEVHRESNNIIP